MNDDQVSAEEKGRIQQTMRDLAAEVLQREKAAPGQQDPEYVRWAQSTLNGATAPPPSPAPAAPTVQPQSPEAPASLNEGGEGVLQIRQTETPAPGQTIRPTQAPDQPDNQQGAAQ